MTVPLGAYIAVSAVLFFTGCAGVLVIAFIAGIPFVQRRRLATLRARARASAAAAVRAAS